MPNDTDPEQYSPGAGLASSWPSMRYGDLEALLVKQTGGDQRSVLARFRNLRQMPFPDAIRTGTGKRVEYDLPRVLALSTAFELMALLIPQSHAVAIVRDTWPELVRGFIGAAVELGVARRPGGMPRGVSGVVEILPDGFAAADGPIATASNLARPEAEGPVPGGRMRIDCGALLTGVMSHTGVGPEAWGEAPTAFADLDRSFGWSRGSVPHRASARDLFAGSSFLDRGPYLERAAAFLRLAASPDDEAAPAVHLRPRSREAAQNLLDYLDAPSPIDEWKGELGTEEGRPRLKHHLAAVGAAAGLTTATQWPGTILATTGASAAENASALIETALSAERTRQAERKEATAT